MATLATKRRGLCNLFLVFTACYAGGVTSAEQVYYDGLMAKAAGRIYNTDFVWENPEREFFEDELAHLAARTDALEAMICDALTVGHSVLGAELLVYYKLDGCIEPLRARLLEPGRFYGWEGTAGLPNNHLHDNQYPYHHRYFGALEALFDPRKLREGLALSQNETRELRMMAADPSSEHYEWAQWLLYRLNISVDQN
ncbi:MAG: hypothetical protein AAGC71_03905 [Pseudomonadota bacterium]